MSLPQDRVERPWMVINQSQSPSFQALLEDLTEDFGQCILLTGMPYAVRGNGLKTIQGPSYKRASVAARLLSWIGFMTFASWRLLSRGKPRFLLVTTNPPFLPHLAWLSSKLRGVPYVLLFWDIYPDHAIRQGWLRAGGLPARAWRSFNRRAVLCASAVVTLGNRMANALECQAGSVEIEIIPNWADTEVMRPIPKTRNPFAVEHDQVAGLTVLYSGNIGRTHGVERLVEAAAQLMDVPEVKFLVIGDGLGSGAARKAARRLSVKNLDFLPWQPWKTVPLSLATAEVAVILQEPGSENLSVPSKTYSHMAAGSAIVACTPKGSDLADLVRGESVGIVVDPSDAKGLATAIRQLAHDASELQAYRRRARQVAELRYSADSVRPKIASVLQKANDSGPGSA